jgi:hypothetical protein
VIEHYVDPGYRFAGLWALARYLWERRRPSAREDGSPGEGTGPGR